MHTGNFGPVKAFWHTSVRMWSSRALYL